MNRDLLRRLELLERQLENKTCPVACWTPDETGLRPLAAGERIVRDIYRIKGSWVKPVRASRQIRTIKGEGASEVDTSKM